MNKSGSLVLSCAGVLMLGTVAVWTSRSLAQPRETFSVSAAYVHGALRVSIPYRAPRNGQGSLLVEVLDPEDRPAARTDGHADANAGQGFWNRELVLPKSLPFDELVWHRLRYRFTYANEKAVPIEGVTSISRILRLPVVHVLGQQSYISGSAAAVRLIVNEADNETPVTSGSVQIELIQPGHKSQVLFTGTLNERATTPVQFHFPPGLVGSYSLRFAIDTSLGPVEHVEEIRLEDKSSILLTTEKPIYQPGQTIHVRALTLDRSNHQAVAGRQLTLEIDDPRGNKVFRKITQTDPYGLASAEFSLADEVNLGAYHLRAILNGASGATSSEIALQVDRYVLPRFKVAVELSGKDNKAKRGYRPGDHVTGTVRANYFFGKPVNGEVTVKASGFDVARFDAGNATGRTDSEGAFQFDIRLPDYFAGRSLNQGAARVLIDATVKDTSGHSESRGEPVMVSESPLLITVVPESGSLVPGLENRVYVLTSYPDGTPAESDLRVEAVGNAVQTATTDKGGIAIVSLPVGGTIVRVKARDREGNQASVRAALESRATGSDQVLLRAERAVYRAGEPIRLEVLSTRQSGSAYVDVVKDGQTIGTHDLNIANGRAGMELAATPGMAGTVELHAYLFGSNASVIGDRRLVFVQPADELRIETLLDAPVYKPGSEARIGFRVTNNRGQGVQAALGVEIIDQAVFALAEKQPGFAKLFFYLEQEALKPRYEIHSVTLSDAVTSAEPAESNRRDRAAQALFAAAQLIATNSNPSEFGRTVPQDKYRQFASRYLARLRDQIDQIATVESGGKSQTCDQTLVAGNLRKADFRDAWGNHLRVDSNSSDTRTFAVRSAGPDGQFYTPDDLIQFRDERHCIAPAFRPTGRGIDVRIEPTGDAGTETIGTVTDPSGAVVPGASIRLVERATGKLYTLASGAEGGFAFSGLAAGSFEIQVSSAGFRTATREISLAEGDRAIFSVVLEVGSVTETVEVMAAAPTLNTMSATVGPVRGPRRAKEASSAASLETTPETHMRSWFPEALYVTPKIVTDSHGHASITIPIADNITTWRMAMMASTKQGSIGSGTSSLKVFQDFFTELDLPATLTQGDRVSLPVAVYNYTGKRGHVCLRLAPDDWFSLASDPPEKSLVVENDRVGGSQFTIEAKRIGKFKLTLKAELDGLARRADIVIREIEVVPNGRQQTVAFNGRVEGSVEHAVTFPPEAIPDAGKIFVRLYPGPLSQVVEGMDVILRMPYGCFEQTSSATYPNVLALDYMKRTKKVTPEVHAKAEGFIATGYQRLLAFEVSGGGFSWFGQAPANKILTSYGLMEFADMAKVHDVDARVIHRTQQWLARQQQSDGSWKPDTNFINEGATDRYNTDLLRITAYIAWALQNSGYQGPEIERARQFISRNLSGTQDAYTLAVLSNFATDFQQDRALTRQLVQKLMDARTEKDDQAWWTVEQTAVYGRGTSAAVETTGLVLQSLLKSGEGPEVARKALNYIAARKDASGAWGTTQATIMALRALLLSMEKGSAEARGTVEITLNSKPAGRLTLTRENGDLFHQVVLKGIDFNGSNKVGIQFEGTGSPAYQVAGQYFVPWTAKTSDEPLSIEVSYDRTRLSQGDFASAIATVKNHLSKTANMVMVDLGIPPGFELLTEDFDDYRNRSAGRKSGRLEKFTLTATQAILYFDSIGAGETIALRYRLRAKYPIRTRTFQSRVYEYYDPEVMSVARPVEMEIRWRRETKGEGKD
jgi:uncharacterized protein YfaS (alpha-2-macroglobulin family)